MGGGAIGREGPTLQISTSVFHYFGKKVRRFVPETAEQTWIVAGAAAGLASAFNTPLGGIVYAIEELGVTHFHRIRTALVSAVIISGVVAQWLLGSYLYLGYPQLQTIEFSFLPIALLTGVVTGFCGGAFGRLLFLLLRFRTRIFSVSGLALVTLACGLAMAGLTWLMPQTAGTGVEVITGFLFRGEVSSPQLVGVRFFGTIISYLSGGRGRNFFALAGHWRQYRRLDDKYLQHSASQFDGALGHDWIFDWRYAHSLYRFYFGFGNDRSPLRHFPYDAGGTGRPVECTSGGLPVVL